MHSEAKSTLRKSKNQWLLPLVRSDTPQSKTSGHSPLTAMTPGWGQGDSDRLAFPHPITVSTCWSKNAKAATHSLARTREGS